MKTLPLVLALSLVGNIALVSLVLVRPSSSTSATAKAEAAAAGEAAAQARATAAAKAKAAAETQLWSAVSSTDPATLMARLRAAGFPPSVVRAIVTAQIRADLMARRRALNPGAATTPFWKNDHPDPKVAAALRELSKETNAQINQLFGGPDPDSYLGMSIYERQQYGDLPADKAGQLARVKRDYDELRNEIYESAFGVGGGGGTMLPGDRAKLELLKKEQLADFAQVLTPQELEDYNLRSSDTASQLRYSLSAFSPTEAEFRSIYQMQAAFDAKYGQNSQFSTQEQMRQRNTEQQKLNADIKTALGAERGAEYERAIDYSYRQASVIADRLSLPATVATDVWNLQKDVQKQTNALYSDQSISPADKQAKQAALVAEASTKVTAIMGERGASIYKQNGGYWLQPPPARGATTTSGVISISR